MSVDHRCLYGHRVPADFTFAIDQRLCPRCGAPTVTVEGYGLARKLATGVPLEAVDAFNVVRLVESEYTLAPRVATPPPEVSMAEIELDTSEEEMDAAAPPSVKVPEPSVAPAEPPEPPPEDVPVPKKGKKESKAEAKAQPADDDLEASFFNET